MISGKTGGLFEGVFHTILIAFIALVAVFFPSLYYLSAILIPLPVCLLVLRLDARYSIIGIVLIWFVMLVTGQELMLLIMILQYGFLGMILGLLIKNRVSSGKSLVVIISVSAILALTSVAVLYALTGENPFVLSQGSRQFLEQMATINQQAFDGLMSEEQTSFIKVLVGFFEMLLPGQLIVSEAISGIVIYFLVRVLLEYLLKYELPKLPAFSEIYLPWYSIWGLIIGLVLILLGDQATLPFAAWAGKNILFVLFNAYLFLGLSVVVYYYRKINWGMLLKLIFVFLVFSYLPFSITVLLLLGATDPLINFRRLPALKE
ncbi:MAG: DUF2232 domain-containing protein [Desulfotomaculaceae bacterium]|nr:DUF2232 domain-containing protein [Desulfotomaculaceae bacterium]